MSRLLHEISLTCNEIYAMMIWSHYLRMETNKSLSASIEKYTHEQYCGGETNILRSVPQYLLEVQKWTSCKINSNTLKWNVWIYFKDGKTNTSSTTKIFKMLRWKANIWRIKLREKIQNSISNDKKYGYVLFFSPLIVCKIFDQLITAFSFDAPQCFGVMSVNLITFYGLEVDHRQSILRMMFIADNENERTSTIFMDFIKTYLQTS